MTIPSSGALSFATIQNEFQLAAGATNLNMNAYKNINRFTPTTDTVSKFPTTNIKFSDFYGKSKNVLATLSGSNFNFVARTYVLARGWDGTSAIGTSITVSGNVYGTNPTDYAFDTGVFPSGSSVNLTINPGSYIVGAGGDGGFGSGSEGTGGTNGESGGPAIILRVPTQITNNGTFAGGGGGGGGGGGRVVYYAAGSGGGGAGGSSVPGVGGTGGPAIGEVNGSPAAANGTLLTGGAGAPSAENVGLSQDTRNGGDGGDLGKSGQIGLNNYFDPASGPRLGGSPGQAIKNASNLSPGSSLGTYYGGIGVLQSGSSFNQTQFPNDGTSQTITNSITLTPDDPTQTTWSVNKLSENGISITVNSGTTTRSVTFQSSSTISETKTASFIFTATNGTTSSSIEVYTSHQFIRWS